MSNSQHFQFKQNFLGWSLEDTENTKFLVPIVVGAAPGRSALCQLTFSCETADQFAELVHETFVAGTSGI